MEYLEAKQVILIFFLLKKAFMMGTQQETDFFKR